MMFQPKTYSVSKLHKFWKSNTIKMPSFQREGGAWPKSHKSELLDTIIKGFPIPLFYANELFQEGKSHPIGLDIIDGQQRIEAIMGFLNNEFSLPDNCFFEGNDISKLYYSELDVDVQSIVDEYELSIIMLNKFSDSDISLIFRRLQKGITLAAADVRNAIYGKMRDAIIELVDEGGSFFECLTISKKKRNHHKLASMIMCCHLADGPTNVTKASLDKMYEHYKSSDLSKELKSLKRILNIMKDTFGKNGKSPEITHGFLLPLFLMMRSIDKEYIIDEKLRSALHDWLKDFHFRFSQQKDDVENYPHMVNFRIAQSNGSDAKHRILERMVIMQNDFFQNYGGLKPKDEKRSFDQNQRIAIYNRGNGQCNHCNKSLEFDSNWHADHIIPHSKGGVTTVDNGQLLCQSCNLIKGSREFFQLQF